MAAARPEREIVFESPSAIARARAAWLFAYEASRPGRTPRAWSAEALTDQNTRIETHIVVMMAICFWAIGERTYLIRRKSLTILISLRTRAIRTAFITFSTLRKLPRPVRRPVPARRARVFGSELNRSSGTEARKSIQPRCSKK